MPASPATMGTTNHQIVPHTSKGRRDNMCASIDAGNQDRDRGIERQHVVRQLGDHQFEHEP